jgi:hypothetical protein
VDVTERFADGLASQHDMTQLCHEAASAAFSLPDPGWPAGASRPNGFDLLPTGLAAWAASCVASPSLVDIAFASQTAAGAVASLASVAPVVGPGQDRRRKAAIERGEFAAQNRVLRDLFGPLPFRPLPPLSPCVSTWNDGTVVRLATAAYEERSLPAGTLENGRLAVLADALEEAGCQEASVLTHLREKGSHWRGCWVLDLLVNR